VTRVGEVAKDHLLDVALACRPVYTRDEEVAAFELLLQGDRASQGASLSDIEASNPAILETYTQVFQGGRMHRVPSFLKITDELILAPGLPELPKENYILEIPGDILLTAERMERLTNLARHGYRLALAGFDPDKEKLDPLLDVVHIVKVDTRDMDDEALLRATDKLLACGVEMLADNLDCRERFLHCRELGFDYFQGDFLSKPSPAKDKRISGNKVLLLQLLSELHNPDTSPARLEEIALKDAKLTYHILKAVNSVSLGLLREVNSISHAIFLLGLEKIKRYVKLFLVGSEQDKPEALTRGMLVRGRMCEVLAEIAGRDNPVDHFIAGLLSQLDALMDIPMPELLEQVPLNHTVKDALLHRSGSLGEVLREVELYEKGHFGDLTLLEDRRFYETAYRHSTTWARQAQQTMRYES